MCPTGLPAHQDTNGARFAGRVYDQTHRFVRRRRVTWRCPDCHLVHIVPVARQKDRRVPVAA